MSAASGAAGPVSASILAPIARHPRLAAVLGALCIATSGIFYRFAESTPADGTVFRCLYGLPILLLVARSEHRAFGALPRRSVALAFLAGLFFGGDLTAWHHSIEFVGAGLATVLGNLQLVVVAFLTWALFGERPSNRALIGIPIVLAGAVLISGVLGTAAYGSDPALGVLLGLITACFYGGYLIAIRRSARDPRRAAGPVAVSTMGTLLVGLVAGVAMGEFSPVPTWPGHGWLLAYGITSQSVGYLLISVSLPRLPAVLTSFILLLQPVTTVALARILLGETPSLAQLVGVGLIVFGVAFATVSVERLRRTRGPASAVGA